MSRPAPTAGGLDVVVRFHDPARLDELGRAVFSLALQDHRPLAILVVCQRFDDAALDATAQALAPLIAIAGDVVLEVLNRPQAEPPDARAALLNQGLRAGTGRWAAFLDYDDLIYPEGHRLLIAELEASGAAIAFGGVLNTEVVREGVVPLVTHKRRLFQGEGLRQLLHSNFCPLHSFVLDRQRIAPEDLWFDETLAALEDYDFLLRLCARYPASFRLKDTIIGEYLLKDDDSNINPFAHGPRSDLVPNATWEAAKALVWPRKAGLVLSPPVQASLGVDQPGLTVAAFLAR